MSKGDTFENDLLKLIFNATPIANLADNAAASPLTNLYVSLHTADPGEAGSEATSEVSYTGYARVAVPRTTGGWVVTGNSVSPAANIDFPPSTGGTGGSCGFFAVGVAAAGATKILYSGTVSPAINVANGVTPRLPPSSTITED
jgi:hypothetical protein